MWSEATSSSASFAVEAASMASLASIPTLVERCETLTTRMLICPYLLPAGFRARAEGPRPFRAPSVDHAPLRRRGVSRLGKLAGLAALVIREDLQLLAEVDLAHRHPGRYREHRCGEVEYARHAELYQPVGHPLRRLGGGRDDGDH